MSSLIVLIGVASFYPIEDAKHIAIITVMYFILI